MVAARLARVSVELAVPRVMVCARAVGAHDAQCARRHSAGCVRCRSIVGNRQRAHFARPLVPVPLTPTPAPEMMIPVSVLPDLTLALSDSGSGCRNCPGSSLCGGGKAGGQAEPELLMALIKPCAVLA